MNAWDAPCAGDVGSLRKESLRKESMQKKRLRKERLRKEQSFHIVSACSGRSEDFRHGESLENMHNMSITTVYVQ